MIQLHAEHKCHQIEAPIAIIKGHHHSLALPHPELFTDRAHHTSLRKMSSKALLVFLLLGVLLLITTTSSFADHDNDHKKPPHKQPRWPPSSLDSDVAQPRPILAGKPPKGPVRPPPKKKPPPSSLLDDKDDGRKPPQKPPQKPPHKPPTAN
ncbi:hypothetical protein ACLB2K_035866 [Fragaria x ananassa]